MARAKTYCRGKKQDGSPCNNWALQNSYYCKAHQHQESYKDRQDMQNANTWGGLIIVGIIIVGFIISLIAGCEDEFLKWMTR